MSYRYRKTYKSATAKVPTIATTAAILRQMHVVNPDKVLAQFKRCPDSFDFKNITTHQIDNLLAFNFELFAPRLNVNSISVYERVRWLTTKDVAAKYIDLEKLPSYAIDNIVSNDPKLVKTLKIPLSRISYSGWQTLVNYDKSRLNDLSNNLSTLRDKTKLRRLLTANIEIFPLLTINAMQSSVLTAKEWALLLLWPKNNAVVKYSPEVTEWLDQEILTEVLVGDSKSSKQLNTALSLLRG
jgi:hypothetical protein